MMGSRHKGGCFITSRSMETGIADSVRASFFGVSSRRVRNFKPRLRKAPEPRAAANSPSRPWNALTREGLATEPLPKTQTLKIDSARRTCETQITA